ncbi:hypothetical protein WN51_08708 [Melipona quadrifasciata]|uniref:SH3 domain-containing protein n=1 Tax=Melipona quadrifasciata TaxID=166423 RepID=A0A0M8ZPZ3_9HYME|nr:hypothetical protein WN51_08708 [Melipona quadrifasciata]
MPSDNGHLAFAEGEKLKVILEVDSKWLLCARGDRKGHGKNLISRNKLVTLNITRFKMQNNQSLFISCKNPNKFLMASNQLT